MNKNQKATNPMIKILLFPIACWLYFGKKTGIKFRYLLVVFVATYLSYIFVFGFYSKFFDISWDQEMQLHDGSVIVVNIKRTYQRRHKFKKWLVIPRKNQVTFKPSENAAPIVFESRLPISFLDKINGNWYLVLFSQGPYGYADESSDKWGHDFNQDEERLAVLKNGEFQPIIWSEAPPNEILKSNFGSGIRDISHLAKFDKKIITLQDKKEFKRIYLPSGPGGGRISRPLKREQPKGNLND